MSVINWPILYINDPLQGRPLFQGQIFVGIPGLDPEDGNGNPINSKQLRVVLEDGTKVDVGQPFILSSGGNPVYNGSYVRLDVDGNYSIKILSKLGAQTYYIENVFEGQPVTELDLINDLSQAYELNTLEGDASSAVNFAGLVEGKSINVKERSTGNGGKSEWFAVLTSTVTPNGIDIVQSIAVPTLSLILCYDSEMTGLEFGLVSDFVKTLPPAAVIGTPNDDVMERMQIVGDTVSVKYSVPKGAYLFHKMWTIRHGVKMAFNESTIALNYTGTKNDSITQFGNNTELHDVGELLYRSTSPSAAGAPMLKIGEFYAKISGAPNQFENSLDSSYWEVENVSIKNVKGFMDFTPDATYKAMTAMVSITGGKNVVTKGITGDGAMGDSDLMMRSVIRTETGYDINARRQGYDLDISSTFGFNLDAGTEDAVVTINGDLNTSVKGTRGEFCGQIVRVGTNGTEGNQSPELRGENGVNITIDGVVGLNSRKKTAFSPTHSLAGLNLTGGDSVTMNGPLTNRTKVTVDNVYIQGIEVEDATWSRIEGITVGDFGSYGGVIPKINRPIISNFEAYWCTKGFVEYDYAEGGLYSNGHLRFNSNSGAQLAGKNGMYNNIKADNNNTAGNAFGFNSNGFSISTKRAKFNNCIFGDADITSGTETQLSSVVITGDNTSATFESCYIANYKTGNADITARGAVDLTTCDIYIDQRCRGVRNISSTFPIAPEVASYTGNIQANGATNTALNCTVSYVSAGRYLITFDTNFQPLNANYILSLTAFGGTGAEVNMDYSSNSTTSVTVYTKVAGVLTDAAFGFIIWADTPTIQAL